MSEASPLEHYLGRDVHAVDVCLDEPRTFRGCDYCVFDPEECRLIPCAPSCRQDRRNVYFVELTEESKP